MLTRPEQAHLYKRHAWNDQTSYNNLLFPSFKPVCIQHLNNVVTMLVQRYVLDVSKASECYIDVLSMLFRRKKPDCTVSSLVFIGSIY